MRRVCVMTRVVLKRGVAVCAMFARGGVWMSCTEVKCASRLRGQGMIKRVVRKRGDGIPLNWRRDSPRHCVGKNDPFTGARCFHLFADLCEV